MLDLLTALAESSLVLAEGGSAPRYTASIGTIKEYAGHRLTEAGSPTWPATTTWPTSPSSPSPRKARLRRAGQRDWLATLGAERDNIGAAMRGKHERRARRRRRCASRRGRGLVLVAGRAQDRGHRVHRRRWPRIRPGEVTDESQALGHATTIVPLFMNGKARRNSTG